MGKSKEVITLFKDQRISRTLLKEILHTFLFNDPDCPFPNDNVIKTDESGAWTTWNDILSFRRMYRIGLDLTVNNINYKPIDKDDDHSRVLLSPESCESFIISDRPHVNCGSYLIWLEIAGAWMDDEGGTTINLLDAKRLERAGTEDLLEQLNQKHIQAYAVPVNAFSNAFSTKQTELEF